MVVKLTEIIKTNKLMSADGSLPSQNYVLREVFVNPEHIVCIREDCVYKKLLTEGRLLKELDKKQSFTKIYLNRGHAGIELIVVGSPTTVQEKLGTVAKQLLKG